MQHLKHFKGFLPKTPPRFVDPNRLPSYDFDEMDYFTLWDCHRALAFATSRSVFRDVFLSQEDPSVSCQINPLIPKKYGIPLLKISEKLKVSPWIIYADMVTFGGVVKNQEETQVEMESLDLIDKFTNLQSEKNFFCVHYLINVRGREVPQACCDIIEGRRANDHQKVYLAFLKLKTFLYDTIEIFRKIPSLIDPKEFSRFRVFFMGPKENTMFKEPLVFEGAEDFNTSFLRGTSAGSDPLIEAIDITLNVISVLPDTDFNKTLRELRSYMPHEQIMFSSFLRKDLAEAKLDNFIQSDYKLWKEYLLLLEALVLLRREHLNMALHYIGSGKGSAGTYFEKFLGLNTKAAASLLKESYDTSLEKSHPRIPSVEEILKGF